MFRARRFKALNRLNKKPVIKEAPKKDEIDPLADDEDFDAGEFLGIKEENFEEVDIFKGADPGLIDKFIQVLSNDRGIPQQAP